MVSTMRVRANRVSRDAHDRVALTVAYVFKGHDGGVTALLAATVRLDPKMSHETRVCPTGAIFADQADAPELPD
jgi:hypothetical protein